MEFNTHCLALDIPEWNSAVFVTNHLAWLWMCKPLLHTLFTFDTQAKALASFRSELSCWTPKAVDNLPGFVLAFGNSNNQSSDWIDHPYSREPASSMYCARILCTSRLSFFLSLSLSLSVGQETSMVWFLLHWLFRQILAIRPASNSSLSFLLAMCSIVFIIVLAAILPPCLWVYLFSSASFWQDTSGMRLESVPRARAGRPALKVGCWAQFKAGKKCTGLFALAAVALVSNQLFECYKASRQASERASQQDASSSSSNKNKNWTW